MPEPLQWAALIVLLALWPSAAEGQEQFLLGVVRCKPGGGDGPFQPGVIPPNQQLQGLGEPGEGSGVRQIGGITRRAPRWVWAAPLPCRPAAPGARFTTACRAIITPARGGQRR